MIQINNTAGNSNGKEACNLAIKRMFTLSDLGALFLDICIYEYSCMCKS